MTVGEQKGVGGRMGVARVSLRAGKPLETVWEADPREVGGFSDAVFFTNSQTLYMLYIQQKVLFEAWK